MSLTYGSVCSGIEAATVAWHPLGWRPSFFSEIEAAPRAVLSHHYPDVPLHGDFTTIREGDYAPIDLLVGGTPCQDFSVAGLRAGVAGQRGNLTLEFLRLAQRLRPRWVVWENVPGVLSSVSHVAPDPCPPPPPVDLGCDGAELETEDEYSAEELHAFNCFLAGLSELGYGFSYRALDAQYVRVDGFERAVPQRRRRVFVVGHLGDWRRAAAVLFERACLRGDPAPRRGAGAAVAALTANGVGTCGADDNQGQAGHLVAHSLRGEGFDASEDGTGRGTPIVPVAYGGNDTRGPIQVATAVNAHGGPCGRLDFESETLIAFDCKAGGATGFAIGDVPGALRGEGAGGGHAAIAFSCKDHGADATDAGVTPTLRAMGFAESHANAGGQLAVAQGYAVRRLIPEECEALQGFKRGYTAVPWRGGILPDGPRYKALGNSMACNVMRWIGRRIEMVETAFPALQPKEPTP